MPRRSLGTVVTAIVLALISAVAVVFTAGYEALQFQMNAGYQQAREAQEQATQASRYLTALMNQEVGLRGYLAGGDPAFLEPLKLGVEQERAARAALLAQPLGPDLSERLRALDAVTDHWHDVISDPQRRAREAGPLTDLAGALRDGKLAFDRIRLAHARVVAALDAHAARLHGAMVSRVEWIRVIVFACAAVILAIAIAVSRKVLGRTTRPLAELVERAERHSGFAAPTADGSTREVFALATALHELDKNASRQQAELERAHDDALALARFGEFAQQVQAADELYAGLDRVCQRVGAPSKIHILSRNASKNRLEVVRPELSIEEQLHLPILTDPMACRAVRTMREVVNRAGAPTACDCPLVPATGSHACMPMMAAGELVGVVNLQSTDDGDFHADRLGALQGYVGFAGSAVSSLQLLAATRERSLRDGLTGAHNRGFLTEYLPKTLAQAARRGASVALLMVDIDHFKRINDVHGHLAGDQALVAFSRCLQQQMRSSDLFARYGGEEFAIVLPDITREAAIATAERFRTMVETVRVTINGQETAIRLTASFGLARFPGDAREPDELIAVADRCLYRAKRLGRNRLATTADAGADDLVGLEPGKPDHGKASRPVS